ncbi:MAG: hypothetical protein E4H20_10900 [Spirochaetales bacterium]|nr:MAG: hypothetical protein E4H20_10900 [Spirochaetales bacterium]
MSDGLKISFEIENISERDIVVGLRYLFDTWLGEKSGNHFTASGGTVLASESLYSGSYEDTFISSGDGNVALSVVFGEPSTRPNRVLIANWKRLNDSLWNIESNSSRNFTLLPYSINDSALAVYYDGASVRRGATRTVSLLLTAGSPVSPAIAKNESGAAAAANIAAIPVSGSLDLMADLISARTLLAAINQALAAGASVEDEQLKALRIVLERLEARRAGY